MSVFGAGGMLLWEAHAAGGLAEQAKSIALEVEADAAAGAIVGPALRHAREALAQAEAAGGSPEHAALLEAMALEWAQVAKDLQRASAAEQASDRLEQEVSAVQTEVVRSRAAVEQAMARVGRARQDLTDLEAGRSKPEADGSTGTR